jgi:hypothetical protein
MYSTGIEIGREASLPFDGLSVLVLDAFQPPSGELRCRLASQKGVVLLTFTHPRPGYLYYPLRAFRHTPLDIFRSICFSLVPQME